MTRALVRRLANLTRTGREVVGDGDIWSDNGAVCTASPETGTSDCRSVSVGVEPGVGPGVTASGISEDLALPGKGLPSLWTTSRSSKVRGGDTFICLLHGVRILRSTEPGVSSGIPKTGIEPRRPCCSKSSTRMSKSHTCYSRLAIALSFSSIRLRKHAIVALACVRASERGFRSGVIMD